MAPLNGWGSTASRLEPLQCLLFTTTFPEIPGELTIIKYEFYTGLEP